MIVKDKVKYLGEPFDRYHPQTGTIGTIEYIDSEGDPWVAWPKGSCKANVRGQYTWCCDKDLLEVVICE